MSKDNTHNVVRAVVIEQGHILLFKTTDMQDNFYFLPGGHIEHGESAKFALHREMIEETGCEITILRFLGCLENVFEISERCKCHNHDYSFIFEVQAKNLKLHTPLSDLDEGAQLLWMPLSELENIEFKAEPLKKLIPQWLDSDFNLAFDSVVTEKAKAYETIK